jgi:hypothetical protein
MTMDVAHQNNSLAQKSKFGPNTLLLSYQVTPLLQTRRRNKPKLISGAGVGMKAKFLGLLAYAAISIVAAGPSHAMSLVGTPSDASGIDGLVVDGVTYDVTFYNSSYDSIYSSTVPTFLGNSGGAADAASALASVLSSFGVTELVGIGPQANALLVPFSDARLYRARGPLSRQFPVFKANLTLRVLTTLSHTLAVITPFLPLRGRRRRFRGKRLFQRHSLSSPLALPA